MNNQKKIKRKDKLYKENKNGNNKSKRNNFIRK